MVHTFITGGNAGLGLETAKELCRQGHFVTITARSESKGAEAVASIQADVPNAQVQAMVMDLNSLASVRACGRQYLDSKLPLHILINNAGIMNTPFLMTEDGIESQFQTNHLGHFLLTHLLLPRITSCGGGRVVTLASRAHLRYSRPLELQAVTTETKDTYDGWTAYGRSKLSNILFSRSLASRFPLQSSGITFTSLHPGLVATNLLTVGAPGMFATALPVTEGIQGTLFCATSPDAAALTGKYLHEKRVATLGSEVSAVALSDAEADKLWQESLRLTQLTAEQYGV